VFGKNKKQKLNHHQNSSKPLVWIPSISIEDPVFANNL
jgi:hypothetical protein